MKRASQYAISDSLEEDIDLDGDTWTTTHNDLNDVKEGILKV